MTDFAFHWTAARHIPTVSSRQQREETEDEEAVELLLHDLFSLTSLIGEHAGTALCAERSSA